MKMIDVYSDELRDYIYEVDNAKRREVLLLVEKEIKRLNMKGARRKVGYAILRSIRFAFAMPSTIFARTSPIRFLTSCV